MFRSERGLCPRHRILGGGSEGRRHARGSGSRSRRVPSQGRHGGTAAQGRPRGHGLRSIGLQVRRRLSRLHHAPRARAGRWPDRARARLLRQRGGHCRGRQQDSRGAGLPDPGSLRGPPGCGRRRHERALSRRAHHRGRAGLGPYPGISRRPVQWSRPASAAPRQGGRPRRRTHMKDAQLDQLAINTIRTLSIDAVQAAKSGHPGTPMALAPLVYTLWNRVMHFDPQDPIWPNRDRFVLSNGHASMLLWSVLYLTRTVAVNAGYERLGKPAVTLDDIRRFRQLDSKAAGHPEYHWTSGVETTTGPLGQGIATSVGMAIARKWLASRYNRPGFEIFDYNIYAICGDGCLMEGVGSEAASLAGHLGLDDLCWIYDNNHISIDGKTRITFTEDVAARFLAYHWNVLRVGDANDLESIEEALAVFRKTKDRPTLIILDSHIGYGSPHKVDTPAAHGEPLGEEEVKLVKRAYHWPENAEFLVPDGVEEQFEAGIGARGGDAHRRWETMFVAYREGFADFATEIDQMQRRELPAGWDRNLPSFPPDSKGIAGRDASSRVLNVLAQNIPWFLGGSADLASSNRTALKFPDAGEFESGTPDGRNLHFGIREHAMAAIVNGLSLSKLRAFGSTFLIFSDY